MRYPLGADRGVPTDLPIDQADCLICVDYFGLTSEACESAVARYPDCHVIVDASQSLFHTAHPRAITAYSPRKFAGLPDGGFLVGSNAPLPSLGANSEASDLRRRHMWARDAGEVAEGYLLFQESEATLSSCDPRAMSPTTRASYLSIDLLRIRNRRVTNYLRLASQLATHGVRTLPLASESVPLCCPVSELNAPALRARLASSGVYCPMFWPDTEIPGFDHIGRQYRDHTVYLPCDQRYDERDMDTVIRSILRCV